MLSKLCGFILFAFLLTFAIPLTAQNSAILQDAEKRIEKYRKADLLIFVKDQKGTPIPGATIHINMKKHAFLFGSELKSGLLYGDFTNENYKQVFLKHFNAGVLASELKWGPWNGEWDQTRFKTEEYIVPGNPFDRERTLAVLRWLKAQNIYVRATNLVWPGWRYMPMYLKAYRYHPEGLPQIILEHIHEITRATGDYIDEWDVINEPAEHHEIMDIFGNEIMLDWFQAARQELAEQVLVLNENNLLLTGKNIDPLEKNIQYLLDHNAPITAVGIQGHMERDTVFQADTVFQRIDRLAKFGLPLRITEFDHEGINDQHQAQYLHDFYVTVFSHPAVECINMWGFWEGAHWKPPRALFRKDWSIKPNGLTYKDLVFNKWWTNSQGITDDQGQFGTRGFLGSYEIQIKFKKTNIIQEFDLRKEGHTLTFILP